MSASLESLEVNGKKIDIIYEKDTSLPIVYMKLVFKGGGYISDGTKVSLSKFTAKILGDGTKTLGGVKFAEKLEERAIKFSISSGFETSTIDISSLKEQFDFSVDSVVELLNEPNFTKSAFEKTQAALIASSMKKEDDFDYVADSLLKHELFEGTPMASDGLGNRDDIKKITLDDSVDFFKAHYGVENLAVVIGGDIELDEAKKEIAKFIKVLAQGKPFAEQTFETKKITKDEVVYKDTKQAFVYFGSPFHLRVGDKDTYKVRVASFILGSSGFGSRLMEEIRVKNGLAYSVYSRHNLNKTNSYFSGYLQTKLDNEQKAKELVRKVIDDFVKKGATEKELEGAKKFILGSEPLRNETLSQRLSRSFNEYYLGQGLGYSEKELDSISKLTLVELNSFIKAHPEIAEIGFAIVTKKK